MPPNQQTSTKAVLENTYTFLCDLVSFTLPDYLAKQKEQLLQDIDKLSIDFPALNLDLCELTYDFEDDSEPTPPITKPLLPVKLPIAKEKPAIPKDKSSTSLSSETGTEVIADVSAPSLGDQVRGGFLKKKEKTMFNRFKDVRKWCVIHETIFYVFESHNSKKQSAACNIKDAEVVILKGEQALAFELRCPGQSTHPQFQASDEADLKAWFEAVDQVSSVVHNLDQLDTAESSADSTFEPSQPVRGRSKKEPPPPIPQDDFEEENYDCIDDLIRKPPALPPVPVPPVPVPQVKSVKRPPLPLPNKPSEVPKIPPPEIPQPSSAYKTEILDPEDYSCLYYALHKCEAGTAQELSFQRGQIIHIVNREYNDKEWWTGYLEGKIGLVPKAYLKNAYKRVV